MNLPSSQTQGAQQAGYNRRTNTSWIASSYAAHASTGISSAIAARESPTFHPSAGATPLIAGLPVAQRRGYGSADVSPKHLHRLPIATVNNRENGRRISNDLTRVSNRLQPSLALRVIRWGAEQCREYLAQRCARSRRLIAAREHQPILPGAAGFWLPPQSLIEPHHQFPRRNPAVRFDLRAASEHRRAAIQRSNIAGRRDLQSAAAPWWGVSSPVRRRSRFPPLQQGRR